MSKQKCIYCGSTIKSKQLTAKGILKDSEYVVFKKSQLELLRPKGHRFLFHQVCYLPDSLHRRLSFRSPYGTFLFQNF